MKIEVNKSGEIFIDDNKLEYENITTDFLENVVNQSLKDNVTYVLNDDKTIPMVKLFDDLRSMCDIDSEFRKEIEEIDENLKATAEKENNIDDIISHELSENMYDHNK